MNNELRDTCELFLENRATLQTAFKWESAMATDAGSAILTEAGKRVQKRALDQCLAILKANAGAFSELRGDPAVPLLCRMALADDPERYLQDVMRVHKAANMGALFSAEYQLLTVMTVLDRVSAGEAPAYLRSAKELLRRMGREHPFLTSDNDAPYAATLALSGRDPEALIAETEACYALLVRQIEDSDGVQSLSHVLCLYDAPAGDKCFKVLTVYHSLTATRHRFGVGRKLAALGAACMLDLPAQELVSELNGTDDFLKARRGFGDSEARKLLAALLVLYAHRPDDRLVRQAASAAATGLCMTIATAGLL